jgi:hypothetical protein
MVPAAIFQRVLGGTVLAVVTLAFIIIAMGRFSGRGGGPPPRSSVAVGVGDDSDIDIQPAQYHQFEFRLPPRVCTLTGQLDGAGGTKATFEALVLSDEEFRTWVKSQRGGSVRSGDVTSWSPHVTLVGPGRFHLVVRNVLHSAPVRIGIVNGKATCP